MHKDQEQKSPFELSDVQDGQVWELDAVKGWVLLSTAQPATHKRLKDENVNDWVAPAIAQHVSTAQSPKQAASLKEEDSGLVLHQDTFVFEPDSRTRPTS